MILKKSERERINIAELILGSHGITFTITCGGRHKALHIGSKKFPIPSTPSDWRGLTKWKSDLNRFIRQGD